ncbi:MAG: polar amino acid transport system substrate-binding protein, partial [Oceanospirillaceae bacterium]
MKKSFLIVLTTIFLCLSNIAFAKAEVITLYSYHNHPPFVTGANSGLTFELARQLNEQAAGRYLFQVSIVPRSRLNYYLKGWIKGECPSHECEDNWLVPWVNPKWGFIKGLRDNYLWHELFSDENVIVSHASNPWVYKSPESLKELVFAGMRGHRYVGIDDLVKTGDIIRIDGNRERDNLLKILEKRVDATVLPSSTMRYLFKNDLVISKQSRDLKVADTKHQKYIRYAMLPETRNDLLLLLKDIKLKELSLSS